MTKRANALIKNRADADAALQRIAERASRSCASC
jgi:hypothetical protein